jgi:hypothetical protein
MLCKIKGYPTVDGKWPFSAWSPKSRQFLGQQLSILHSHCGHRMAHMCPLRGRSRWCSSARQEQTAAVSRTRRTNVVTRVGAHQEAIRRSQQNKPAVPIHAALLRADKLDPASKATPMKFKRNLPSIRPCRVEVQQVGNPASAWDAVRLIMFIAS